MTVEYIDRRSGRRVRESVMGDGALRFAYETLLGRTLWPVLFGSRLCSAVLGRRYDSPRSKSDIASLASIPGCCPDEAEKPLSEYGSFNEFFTRRLKPGARPLGEGFVSPADGRLRLFLGAYADSPFPLKGARRTLREVFGPPGAPQVPGGRYDVAVVRLAPVDYHRFHFPCDCRTPDAPCVMRGAYHSVNPIALVRRPDVYAENERQIVRAEADFGSFWLVDVGAFGVGTIVQTYGGVDHAKGDEKGYFKFGGSTVILVAPAAALRFDGDLVRNSSDGLETLVRCGERIALPATRQG
ncbi:MAG: phosphatidylserine decarboxylase [Kiritimatiellae bacterium]|nr:phosphatidylserine decarboxylase [Kiritimatiellia bacterium]